MHIKTTALLAISFYAIGRSSAERAEDDTQDGFGLTNNGIRCNHRFYSTSMIYAMANHSCVINKAQPKLKERNFQTAGYRIIYPAGTSGDDKALLNSDRYITPIREKEIFLFEYNEDERFTKDSRGKKVKMTPGKDRLVLGDDCHLFGIFSDVDYPNEAADEPIIKWCTVVGEYSNIFPSVQRPQGGSREQSQQRYPRSLERPQGGLHEPSQQRYSRSPERPQGGSREQSQQRYSRSPERPQGGSREPSQQRYSRSPERPQGGSREPSQQRYSRSPERPQGGSRDPSQASHGALDTTYFGIKCNDRFYLKSIIDKTANHYCETYKGRPDLKERDFQTAGYRIDYPNGAIGDDKALLNSDRHITPIKEKEVFLFEYNKDERFTEDSRGNQVKMTTGKDRLVLDVGDKCRVLGIYMDIDHPKILDPPTIKWCRVFETSSDIELDLQRSSRSPNRSPEGSQRGSRESSPEIYP